MGTPQYHGGHKQLACQTPLGLMLMEVLSALQQQPCQSIFEGI
jgi:hypothetical protein